MKNDDIPAFLLKGSPVPLGSLIDRRAKRPTIEPTREQIGSALLAYSGYIGDVTENKRPATTREQVCAMRSALRAALNRG